MRPQETTEDPKISRLQTMAAEVTAKINKLPLELAEAFHALYLELGERSELCLLEASTTKGQPPHYESLGWNDMPVHRALSSAYEAFRASWIQIQKNNHPEFELDPTGTCHEETHTGSYV